jgi:hypothetical protein
MMVDTCLKNGEEESSAMYNAVELTAEESGNIGCGDNLSGKDSDMDMEADESMLCQFGLKLLTKDGPYCMTVKVH